MGSVGLQQRRRWKDQLWNLPHEWKSRVSHCKSGETGMKTCIGRPAITGLQWLVNAMEKTSVGSAHWADVEAQLQANDGTQ